MHKLKRIEHLPGFGKVIKENFVLGIDAGISFYKSQQNDASSEQKQNSFTSGIFLRQYKSVGKGYYLFLQKRIGYRFEKYYYNAGGLNTNDYKKNKVGLTANPGISYAFSKRLHIESGLANFFYFNYSYLNGNEASQTSGKYKTNTFEAGVDLNAFSNIYVGFRIFIGK